MRRGNSGFLLAFAIDGERIWSQRRSHLNRCLDAMLGLGLICTSFAGITASVAWFAAWMRHLQLVEAFLRRHDALIGLPAKPK